MADSRPRLGVVINHYNPRGQAALRAQTELCALRALASQDSGLAVEVLVSDGTGTEDAQLRQRLQAQGIGYIAATQPLGFAQGYNAGLRFFAESPSAPLLLATCANDVFCDAPTLPLLAGALLTDASVGCALPYLSQADYITQNDWVHKYYREASSMTFNLNVFRTKHLTELGYVPEAFSGYYNDVALMLELRARGLKVVLINGGNVAHLGMATTSVASQARAADDKATFARLYPAAFLPAFGTHKQELLAAGAANKLWLYAQSRGPASWRKLLTEISRLWLQVGRVWYNITHNPHV